MPCTLQAMAGRHCHKHQRRPRETQVQQDSTTYKCDCKGLEAYACRQLSARWDALGHTGAPRKHGTTVGLVLSHLYTLQTQPGRIRCHESGMGPLAARCSCAGSGCQAGARTFRSRPATLATAASSSATSAVLSTYTYWSLFLYSAAVHASGPSTTVKGTTRPCLRNPQKDKRICRGRDVHVLVAVPVFCGH